MTEFIYREIYNKISPPGLVRKWCPNFDTNGSHSINLQYPIPPMFVSIYLKSNKKQNHYSLSVSSSLACYRPIKKDRKVTVEPGDPLSFLLSSCFYSTEISYFVSFLEPENEMVNSSKLWNFITSFSVGILENIHRCPSRLLSQVRGSMDSWQQESSDESHWKIYH